MLILIMSLGKVYEKLAYKLTQFHRRYPGRYIKFFGLRNEECDNGGGCPDRAGPAAGRVIMIGKQIINNCHGGFLPRAFPLARFFRLLNNWLEIPADAKQAGVRDPAGRCPSGRQDIGVWFTLLDV
uniref:Transposase n=1 Tax=Macrostomum lignano TaxID=282301 RepID=A0A1I8FJI6_9PLAT